jgi:APA family basic amino acid/polyamine antiporter
VSRVSCGARGYAGSVRTVDSRVQRSQLTRELGLPGAVVTGLGSIVGTGVFVSIGIAAGIAGPAVLLATALGALVATCNGLSSAQLAANHAVSGGTYEYGYRYLNPWFGFVAGWVFLLAKSASAATAALGFGGYLLGLWGVEAPRALVPLALAATAGVTLVVLAGLRRSTQTNLVIVGVTLGSLVLFVLTGLPSVQEVNFTPFWGPAADGGGWGALLHATALMFVAYTGYGRIATLGEEVVAPRRTIPRAIVTTLLVTLALYVAIAFVGVGAVGARALSEAQEGAAPLALAARAFALPGVSQLVSIGAITATLGVLLNLVLGLSRVLFAMGRRGDMPAATGRLDARGSPAVAVVVIGVVIGLLALTGDVRTTWSFSAFTVLVYYAITNLAALALPASARLYPRAVAVAGLLACSALAFFVEPPVWRVGLGLIGLGLLWRFGWRRLAR